MDNESDLFVRCSKCNHQKVDHERAVSRDKMKCLIEKCVCKSYLPDRKYYRSTKK
jgi:hypothetical protein